MVRLRDTREMKINNPLGYLTTNHMSATTRKAALHCNSQVAEHAEYPAMLYRKNQSIDEQKGKQEVDKMDNQVACRGNAEETS